MTFHNRLAEIQVYDAPNYDKEAHIHFGFIYCNDVSGDAISDIYDNGIDIGYENAKEEAKASVAAMVEQVNGRLADLTDDIRSIIKSHIGDWGETSDIYKELDMSVEELDAESTWDSLSDYFNDSLMCEESGPYHYESYGYIIDTTDDNGLFVIKSPYFTLASQCSPCAPNAGYLTTKGSLKTYCLGPDWFDEDYAPLPYDVYSVETGELVEDAKQDTEEGV